MDKALAIDKLFAFLREFPEFKELLDMQYDEKDDLVRAKMGISEKVILINDKASCFGIVFEVISHLAGE